ncbi:MipA/OmpV family protein [Candidatus Omnitrophota bacterium]
MVKQIFICLSVLFVVVLCVNPPCYARYYSDQWEVESTDDFSGLILGMGALYSTSPYEGVDDQVWPVPIILGRYQRFYADGASVGYVFHEMNQPKVDFSAVLAPRLMGYDSEDSDTLAGMEDRDWSLDGGLRARYTNEYFRLTATGLIDLAGNHEGFEFSTYISKTFFDGFLTPRFGIKVQSEDLVDYYYGVPASEATATRLEYIGDTTVNIVAGVVLAAPLPWENWVAVATFQYEHLGSEIEDSPIVDEDGIFTYTGGVAYKF